MKKKNRARSNTSLEITPAKAAPAVVAELPIPALVKPAQAAAILRVSLGTLAHWRTAGDRKRDLKFVKIGSLVRYRLSDLDAFIATLSQG
jgi:helix-turn-helix protein